MKKVVTTIATGALGLYLGVVTALHFLQERLIFFPQKLDKDHRFAFEGDFEEMDFAMEDGVRLNGLLFKSEASKGLIFYLHGNSGSLASWGDIAGVYTDLGYDLFLLDYRGFGKSEGKIGSEDELHEDVRTVYDSLKARYSEQQIIILGYSIGTGPATRLAAGSEARQLILQAPYYNLAAVMASLYPVIPTAILKYRFETNKYLSECRMPVIIFHGDKDEVIGHKSSLKLKSLLKPADTLILLKGQAHNGISDNPQYRNALRQLLH